MAGHFPRNVLFNFLLQGLLATSSFFVVPFLVRSLGGEQYGIFSLGIFLSSSFLFLDLGVGQALVKYLAEGLGKGQRDTLILLCQTGLTIAFVSGLGGVLLLSLLAGPLAFVTLKIPFELRWVAFQILLISAGGFFVTLLWNTLSSISKGFQRFDVVFIIQGAMIILQALFFMGGAFLRVPLWLLVLSSVLAGMTALIGFAYYATRLLPGLSFQFHWDPFFGKKLLTFGGWVTAAVAIAAVMMQIDKILIGRFLSMTEVGYFIIITNIAKQLPVITGVVAQALFPTLTTLVATERPEDLSDLFQRSIRVGLVPLFAVLLPLVVFGQPLLSAWIDPFFATAVFYPFLFLLLGFTISSWSTFYGTLALATNQPHTFTIASLMNAVLYIGLCLWLIPRQGMIGAGMAFAFSQIVVVWMWMVYLHFIVFKRPLWEMWIGMALRFMAVGFPFYFILYELVPFVEGWSIFPLMVIVFLSIILFCITSFFVVLDDLDRQKILLTFNI